MAIIRINDLPEGSGNLSGDDLFVFLDNPSALGDGITKKITLDQLHNAIGGGSLSIEQRYFDYVKGVNLYGKNNLMSILNLNNDDNEYEIILPFSVTFLGQTYNSVWLNSNSYISFLSVASNSQAGYPIYWPQGPSNLGVPAVVIGACGRNITNYYYGLTDDGRFVIRYEGKSPNGSGDGVQPPTRIWEVWFYQNDSEKISIVVDNNMPEGGVWGLHDGQRWVDVYEQLPRLDQNSENEVPINSVDIHNKSSAYVSKIKFVGQGVETFIEDNKAYIDINPLQGMLNLDLDQNGDTVISSAGYGLTLKSTHHQNINLKSAGDISLEAKTSDPDYPRNGYNVSLVAGDGTGSNKNGGNVEIRSGKKTDNGQHGEILLSSSDNYFSLNENNATIEISDGKICKDFIFSYDGLTFPDGTIQSTAVSGTANTGDITFNGSTISTLNNDQNMTITTNGSGDIYIGADRNMIFDMNAFSGKGIVLQDSQEDGYDDPETPSIYKVGRIYHRTGTMVIESDGKIVDSSGNLQAAYGGIWITNGEETGLNIPPPTGSVFGGGQLQLYQNGNHWDFTNNGNLNLPEGKVLNFGQNTNTLGPPSPGGENDRVRLWDFKGGGTNYNYAIGVEPNHVWFSMDVNNGEGGFKFYSRDNEIFKISDDSKLMFPNGTTIAKGTYDNGTGGNSGISLNCSVGYELNWQGGHLRSSFINDSTATPQTIYCDSPVQFPGDSTMGITINPSGITFPDGSVQNTAYSNISISNLGTLSGSNPINFSVNSMIQTLTLNGGLVTLTKGTGWPSDNTSVDIILRITVSSATTVVWSIVTDWFNQPQAGALSIGTHLFMLRAIGSSIIEGHYIGKKNN